MIFVLGIPFVYLAGFTMTIRKLDPALVFLTATAGLISAFITMSLAYSVGHYAVSHNSKLLDLGQILFPGAVFGLILSCSFFLRGYLRSIWKFLGLTVASMAAYASSSCVAFGVELYSPFLSPEKRGDVSLQALSVGGLVGAFCVIVAVALLLTTETEGRRRTLKILFWTPAGALLGVVGWALGPSLGMFLWQTVHSMNLTAPTETFRNAQGNASHMLSLWAVWQTGMGFVLGLVVDGKESHLARMGDMSLDKLTN